jgi:acyl-coenzyme A synthetase/AMP-(fatty) acid ligase
MNVVGPILHFGKTRRHATALIDATREITYGELADLIRQTADHLAALGLRRGDRIGLCLHDTCDHVVALLGAAYLGGVAVTLDWRAKPAENARFIDSLKLACVLVEPAAGPVAGCTAFPLDDDWRAAVARSDSDPAVEWPSDWHDPFAISATSGSTGLPKFTLMTHTQYYFAIAGMFELMALSGQHRFLCTMPLYYSGGRNSCIAHLLRGDTVVLHSSLFSADEYVELVARQHITVAGIVPSMVRQLLAAHGPEPLLPGLAKLFSTGAPLHAEEKREVARRLTPHFHERYGTAETLAISILRPSDFAERADSVGQPHSLAEIAIVDDDDRPLPAGAVGRLRYRGPGLGSPLPGQPMEANFRGGCYYPGEIARIDEAGYIFLQGRTSDVIMRNGAKVYPAEIEATLIAHPAVAEAAVLGVTGADADETVVAFVVAAAGFPTGELVAHCRARLTPHKVPREIHVVAQLPKNTAGKTDKLALAKTLSDTTVS